MSEIEIIRPSWPIPESVQAISTTRTGGFSSAPFDSLNLADHVGDVTSAVKLNRELLVDQFAEGSKGQWLQQIHSNRVVRVESIAETLEADALVTSNKGIVLNILTADCLPLLLCAKDGSEIAAVHCGWRGLASDMVASTLATMVCAPDQLLAWTGPAIGSCHFEVGAEVREAFVGALSPELIEQCFRPLAGYKFMANLAGITKAQLRELGVRHVSGDDSCTFCDADRFYSYRRDGQCGRMVTSICIT